jgi:hypothetical protein
MEGDFSGLIDVEFWEVPSEGTVSGEDVPLEQSASQFVEQ